MNGYDTTTCPDWCTLHLDALHEHGILHSTAVADENILGDGWELLVGVQQNEQLAPAVTLLVVRYADTV